MLGRINWLSCSIEWRWSVRGLGEVQWSVGALGEVRKFDLLAVGLAAHVRTVRLRPVQLFLADVAVVLASTGTHGRLVVRRLVRLV
jgi:hypothetical protein